MFLKFTCNGIQWVINLHFYNQVTPRHIYNTTKWTNHKCCPWKNSITPRTNGYLKKINQQSVKTKWWIQCIRAGIQSLWVQKSQFKISYKLLLIQRRMVNVWNNRQTGMSVPIYFFASDKSSCSIAYHSSQSSINSCQ